MKDKLVGAIEGFTERDKEDLRRQAFDKKIEPLLHMKLRDTLDRLFGIHARVDVNGVWGGPRCSHDLVIEHRGQRAVVECKQYYDFDCYQGRFGSYPETERVLSADCDKLNVLSPDVPLRYLMLLIVHASGANPAFKYEARRATVRNLLVRNRHEDAEIGLAVLPWLRSLLQGANTPFPTPTINEHPLELGEHRGMRWGLTTAIWDLSPMTKDQRKPFDPADLQDVASARAYLDNVRRLGRMDLYAAAFRRCCELSGQNDASGDPIATDFWRAIAALEEILRAKHGKRVQASRTRQKLARVGVRRTVEDLALAPEESEGFRILAAHGLGELTAEYLVLKHAKGFSAEAVLAARARLLAAGVPFP